MSRRRSQSITNQIRYSLMVLPDISGRFGPAKSSIAVWHKPLMRHRRTRVVAFPRRKLGYFDLFTRNRIVGDDAEQVADTVQSGSLFVVCMNNMSRCFRDVREGEHFIFRPGVVFPFGNRFEVHLAQLPTLRGCVQAALESRIQEIDRRNSNCSHWLVWQFVWRNSTCV